MLTIQFSQISELHTHMQYIQRAKQISKTDLVAVNTITTEWIRHM